MFGKNPESMRCECGWLNHRRKDDAPDKPLDKCEACGKEGTPSRDLDTINVVVIAIDERDKRIRQHAESHNLRVVQLSTNRWIVLLDDGFASFTIGDKAQGGGYAYRTMKIVHGPADWQSTGKYIKENTPELPKYLNKK